MTKQPLLDVQEIRAAIAANRAHPNRDHPQGIRKQQSIVSPSVLEIQATPRSVKAFTVSKMCKVLRPRRSSFHTTTVSPSRKQSRRAARPGRSSLAPHMVSEKVFVAPAAARAAFC
jgi:hypothetical protein